MRKCKAFMNKTAWKAFWAGPLRVKVVVERLDGTELYHMYPLGTETVEFGQIVSLIELEVGINLTED